MMGNDVSLASCFHENAEIIYLYITIKPCNFASGNFISHTGKTRICEEKNNYENDFTPTIIFILIVIISRLFLLFILWYLMFIWWLTYLIHITFSILYLLSNISLFIKWILCLSRYITRFRTLIIWMKKIIIFFFISFESNWHAFNWKSHVA